jgi:hypothetical protein
MASSTDVPGRLPVAIEGHAYQIEPSGYKRETVQVLRQQADASTEPGEASLNPQGLWRRSQETWHHGAGQAFLDGKEGLSAYSAISADPHRFRSSKGIDPWTRGQLSLLHPTLKVWSTTSTNLYLAVAQGPVTLLSYLYVSDGTEVYLNQLPYGAFNTLAVQTGTGWSATNATIAASSTTMFRLTATSAATVSATSPTGTAGVPVDPGRRYAILFESLYISGGAARTPTVSVTWYTSAGASISTTTPVSGAGTDVAARDAVDSPTAPANAAYAALNISYTAASANGEIHEVRIAQITPYDDLVGISSAYPWASATINAGQAAQPVQSITTDGTYVWVALGISGLHRTTGGATTTTADVPAAPGAGQISLAGYANGFLLAAGSTTSVTGANVLWVVNDPLGTPALSVIKTHPNPNFIWTGISQGRSCVYAYGNSGGNGEVYKILYDPNTGALSAAASFATYLPDGETIHALQFYAGGIIMGTGKGVRLGQANGNGDIDYGPLIPTTWPVRCLEPQDRYCWFGWTNYPEDPTGASNNSGLGRVDLGFFTDTLTPAWASDLMTTTTGDKGDVVAAVSFTPYGYTFNQTPPVRVFTVSGKGVYIEDPKSRVSTGSLDTGTVRFSTSEPKTTHSFDIRHHSLPAGATVTAALNRDSLPAPNGFNVLIGSSSTTGAYGPTAPLSAGDYQVEAMEFRLTLTRPTPNGTDYSISPEMTRWTAKVLPCPSTIDETFTIPIVMRHEVVDNNDANYPVNVAAEVAYLKGLEQTRTLVNLQTGNTSQTVYLLASSFDGQNWGPGKTYVEGILTTIWQTVRG